MEVDPKYEYNAPQFVDFDSLDNHSAADPEKYFGEYLCQEEYFYACWLVGLYMHIFRFPLQGVSTM